MSDPELGESVSFLALEETRALIEREVRRTGLSEQDIAARCLHLFLDELSFPQMYELVNVLERQFDWDQCAGPNDELHSQLMNAAIRYALGRRIM